MQSTLSKRSTAAWFDDHAEVQRYCLFSCQINLGFISFRSGGKLCPMLALLVKLGRLAGRHGCCISDWFKR